MGDKLMSVLDDLTRSMARSCGLRLVPPMIISRLRPRRSSCSLLGFLACITELSKDSLDLRSPNGCGCRAGEVTIAICVRRCSGRAFRVLQAGLAFRGSVPGTGLIMSCQGSGHSAQPARIASIPASRSTSARRRSRPSALNFRCYAPVASIRGQSRCSANHSVRREPASCSVSRTDSGAAYLEIRNVGPSEALLLVNRP